MAESLLASTEKCRQQERRLDRNKCQRVLICIVQSLGLIKIMPGFEKCLNSCKKDSYAWLILYNQVCTRDIHVCREELLTLNWHWTMLVLFHSCFTFCSVLLLIVSLLNILNLGIFFFCVKFQWRIKIEINGCALMGFLCVCVCVCVFTSI